MSREDLNREIFAVNTQEEIFEDVGATFEITPEGHLQIMEWRDTPDGNFPVLMPVSCYTVGFWLSVRPAPEVTGSGA